MTKQKPDQVLVAGIVEKKNNKPTISSILLTVHRQKITTAIYVYMKLLLQDYTL